MHQKLMLHTANHSLTRNKQITEYKMNKAGQPGFTLKSEQLMKFVHYRVYLTTTRFYHN